MTRPVLTTALFSTFALLLAAPTGAQSPLAEPEISHAKDIRIHGHWVIEVRRPDGSVRDHREFENSYDGGNYMAELVGGWLANADPAIYFQSSNNGTGSLCNGGVSNSCVIVGSATAGHGLVDNCAMFPNYCYQPLNVALVPSGPGYGSLVLSASIGVVTGGTFDTVGTTVTSCYAAPTLAATPFEIATVSSAQCYTNALQYIDTTGVNIGNFEFTQRTFTPAISITAGENISFQITISFS